MGDNSELMVLSDEEKFLKSYQAIYTAMTAKPDCRSKAYPENVIIYLEDINDLNHRIFEKFKTQYNNYGFVINVVVSIEGRQKLEFPTWRSFEEHTWHEAEIINSIILTWEFNIKLPQIQIPQKHSLTVKLSNGIRPEEMVGLILSGKLDEMEEIEQGVCPIIARMDFIDPGIGGEVLDIVSAWVKSLKRGETVQGKGTLLLQKNRRKLAYLLNYITTLVAIGSSVFIVNKFLLSLDINYIGQMEIEQTSQLIYIIFVCAITCFGVNKISELFCNGIFKVLSDYGEEHAFSITKGDKNRQDKLRKEEKKR